MPLMNIDQNVWLKVYPAIAANAALFVFALLRRPALKTYLMIFSLTTLADILVAGKIVPLGDERLRTPLEYLFVLVGDLRYILLLAFILYGQKTLAELRAFRLTGDVLRPTLIFTLFPTLLVSAINFAKPGVLQVPRHKFLAYELAFFILTLLWIYVVLPQKNISEKEAGFLRRASVPVFVFYGLWSLSDIMILNGIEAGYALRIVPNFVYYCGFLWWIVRVDARTS